MRTKLGNLINGFVNKQSFTAKDLDQLLAIYPELSKEKPPDRPEIVCLCGSTRFSEAFRQAEFQETLAGKIVLTIGCSMRCDDDLFGDMAEPAKQIIRAKLDELHLRKIDLADEVTILNVDGYIGESTSREIDYAMKIGKPIKYLED